MVDFITIFYAVDVVLIIAFAVILYFAYQAYQQRSKSQPAKNAKPRQKQIAPEPEKPRLGTGNKPVAAIEDRSASLYIDELMERKSPPHVESAPEPAPVPVYITDLMRQLPQEATPKPQEPVPVQQEAAPVQAVEVPKVSIVAPAPAAAPEPAPEKVEEPYVLPQVDKDRRCCENCYYYQPLENLENMGTCKNFTCKKYNKTVQAPNLSCERYGDAFVQGFNVPVSDKYDRAEVLRYLTQLRESGYKVEVDYSQNKVFYGLQEAGPAFMELDKITSISKIKEDGTA